MAVKSDKIHAVSITDRIIVAVLAQLESMGIVGNGNATEATLAALNTKFTGVTRVQTFQTISGASGPTTIIAGARGLSFYNAGSTDVTLDGGILLPGVSVSFNAGGEDDVLSAMTYSTLATGILVITKIV